MNPLRHAGLQAVTGVLSAPQSGPRARRRAVSLLQDLVQLDGAMMAAACAEKGAGL